MEIDDIIFIDSLPTIDLHGLDRATSEVMIKDFINDNLKCKEEFIVIIHGHGEYVLLNATHNVLKKHPKVKDYKLFIYNTGCTIAKLDLTK